MKLAIAEQVEELLIKHEKARDNDNMLIAMVWAAYLKAHGRVTTDISAREFFKIMAFESSFPSSESIRRSRQKIQENTPALRGKRYKQRHEELEPQVRMELKGM